VADDYAGFRRGAVQYPIATASSNSLLRDADPVVFYALDYFAGVLETHLSARLLTEASAVGITWSGAVAYKTPLDPTPYLSHEQFKFPLLCVYRKRVTLNDHTGGRRRAVHELECAYIFPPLSAGQAERLVPALHAAADIIDDRTDQGFDPNYLEGALVWGPSYANLEAISFKEGSFGAFPGLDGNAFPAWYGTFTATEANEIVETGYGAFEAFAGSNVSEHVYDRATDTTVQNVVQFNSAQAPTVVSVSPSTGSSAGGTSITITGTLFRAGATVRIGGVLCTSVTVASATSITCTTPAGSAGAHDLTVTNVFDSQVGTLEDAFTYT